MKKKYRRAVRKALLVGIICPIYCLFYYPADMDMTQEEIMKAEYRLNISKPVGWLIYEPTHHKIAVYKPISHFKRFMLRWCFGLKFEKV